MMCLQPSNIFFAADGVIKVGDFGLATSATTSLAAAGDEDSDVQMTNVSSDVGERQLTNNVGTRLYMSPEQVA